MNRKKLMIYGASGYTGIMVAEHAHDLGLMLIVAGREENRFKLYELAERVHAEVRLFSLSDEDSLRNNLSDVFVLLNAAGPFAQTAKTFLRASIEQGVHYLDFSAEIDTYKFALDLDQEAKNAGVMLLPGSGGSVAMLGSLAAHAISKLGAPVHIRIALLVAGSMSQGSVASANQNIAPETMQLIDGKLVTRTDTGTALFDFGEGVLPAFPVTLPDLLTLYRSTGIANIETYVYIAEGKFPTEDINKSTKGPSDIEREMNRYRAAVEVIDLSGATAHSVLDTVNGYTFTAIAAANAAARVINGDFIPGFQTPLSAFGKGFAETIADTKIIDMDK